MALSFFSGNRPWEQIRIDGEVFKEPYTILGFISQSGGSFAYEDYFTLLHCIDMKIRNADKRRPGIIFFCSALTEETQYQHGAENKAEDFKDIPSTSEWDTESG
ncbi:hypothetical protein Peur_017187 [Populus x canadensis]